MDVAALLATLLTQTPLPSPSGAAPAVDGTTGISQWLPLGTALLAAGAAIGASALTQFLSARHEGSRRREQYKRDDLHRRREELKVAYSELISHLNDYLIQSHKTKGVDRLIDQITRLSPDPAGRQAMTAKQTELTEKMIVTVSAVNSLLSVTDLLGESAVFEAASDYVRYIQDLKPDDADDMARGQQLYATMKEAMRESLKGASNNPN